jgi:hypothetical protein
MSVKALFLVIVRGESYPVVVRYEPHDFVAEIKMLVIAELKSNYDGFESMKAGYLTLKTLEGDVILEDEMPKGKKFLAELTVPKSETESKFLDKNGENIKFVWREPYPLLQTEGSKWKYQEDPELCNTLQKEIQIHYDNWVAGVRDKQKHPLFLCMSGPGTGKSRLLNEFPRLVKESVSGIDGLNQFVNSSFCFNISFENGTSENPQPFDPSTVIGTRMMFQLQDQLEWSDFRRFHSYSIPEAIIQVAILANQLITNMCVILCIDGMQKLDHRPGSRDSHFYNTTSAICSVINVHHVFVIAICSATVYNTVN